MDILLLIKKTLRHSGCRSGNLRTALLSRHEEARGLGFGIGGMDWWVNLIEQSWSYRVMIIMVVVADRKALQQASDSRLGLTGGIRLRNQSIGWAQGSMEWIDESAWQRNLVIIIQQHYNNSASIRQQELTQSSDSRLDPYRMKSGCPQVPVVWGIVLVCRLMSVTTV